MKKIWNILMVLMLMVSISALALAQEADDTSDDDLQGDDQGDTNESEMPDENESESPDDNESEIPEVNETEEDVKLMNDPLGAEIRLLQLEKAITKNLLKGEAAVEILKELGYNTTGLEAILAEMRLLLDEVQAADPYSDDAVQVFVDLKSDAIRLTKEYREAAKDLLSDSKYSEIREQIRLMNCTTDGNFSNLSKKIQNRIRQFNRNQIHRLYGLIGDTVNATKLAEQYQNGTCTLEQVRSQLSKHVNNMIKEKKKEIFLEIKGEKTQKQEKAETCVDNASVNFTEREQNRLNKRLEKAEDKYLKQQIRNRITMVTGNGNGQVVDVDNGGNVDGSGGNSDSGSGYGDYGQNSGSGQGSGGPQ